MKALAATLVTLCLISGAGLLPSTVRGGDAPQSERGSTTHAIDLDLSRWRHIRFPKISPTRYTNRGSELWANVERSASFELLPFEAIREIRGVEFEWRLQGELGVRDRDHERVKSGDDLPLRVGLVVSGREPAPLLGSIFGLGTPDWIKKVRDELRHETNRLLFLVVGSRQAPGTRWDNPHSSDIKQVAGASSTGADGWEWARFDLDAPERVVGLWIMADGDDTASSFRVGLRKLKLRS